MPDFLEEYEKYFTLRQFTRLSLFEALNTRFSIEKALYLGSHIHITPSLVFAGVVYVDSYKKFKDMVEQPEAVDFISKNRQYTGRPSIQFIQQNYDTALNIDNDFDLLISQYAGFVSQAGKGYLKKGGILVANNSHGDASIANLDNDYEFIAVANHTGDVWRLSTTNLDEYFIPKSGRADNLETLKKSMKGFAYTKTAANYIFKKVR